MNLFLPDLLKEDFFTSNQKLEETIIILLTKNDNFLSFSI